MKVYKYNEWDILYPVGTLFDDRIYVDDDGDLITGILEGYYGYTSDHSNPINSQYVSNGKRVERLFYLK